MIVPVDVPERPPVTAAKAVVAIATCAPFIGHALGGMRGQPAIHVIGFTAAAILLPIGFLACMRAGLIGWFSPRRARFLAALGRAVVLQTCVLVLGSFAIAAITTRHGSPEGVAVACVIGGPALLGPGVWAAWGMSTHPHPPGFTRLPPHLFHA